MRVHLAAVGRLRAGPERDLVADYLERFTRTGRGIGLSFGGLHEVEDRKGGGARGEAVLLGNAVPQGATVWVLDERGEALSSPEVARALARERDTGTGVLAFVIGGADGLDPDFRAGAQKALSLGPMVWPHMLARVMLSEQLYRAATILSGSPYHRA